MEALQPKQQPSNLGPLWPTTAEERAIVRPHNSIDWRSNNMFRIWHQRDSTPEKLRAGDDVGTESYWPSGPALPSSRKHWSFPAELGVADRFATADSTSSPRDSCRMRFS